MKIPSFLYGWDFNRVFRLALAVLVAIYSLSIKEYTYLVISGYFLILAVFNISCCGVRGYSTGRANKDDENDKNENKTVTFEEIK